jgi:hypothetical protein
MTVAREERTAGAESPSLRSHTASAAGVNQGAKRVLIVCMLDQYSNGVRPVEIERFLRKRGYDAHLANTFYLSRASSNKGSLTSKLPRPGFRRVALYAIEAASLLFTRRWELGRRHLSYYLLRADCRVRRSLLASLLPLDDFDLVICETPHDAELLTVRTVAQTLYDCPTPWADEIYFEGRLTERQHAKLRQWEVALLESVDFLTFWWESYARYAVERYGISGRNLITLNHGCTPQPRRAEFDNPPRVVYLGSLGGKLGGKSLDLPLLSRLSKLYPHIDVYGGPPPDPALGLNYLGYATPAVLQQYQLGLITSTEDELRLYGFSAKHPQYLAYGLPVLVPAARRHLDLLRGSVPYEEQTFLAVVDALSKEDEWRRMSDEAYAQAQRLAWDETLRPLEALLSR